ncbi:MAG: 50S ribosomal protein L21, partial [Actinobacteria bacterium]|nr:50S ribosomal protein L21 [Actinomycetota bacterium]
PGDKITVEKLDVDSGSQCNFEDVVLYNDGKNVVASPKELAKVKVTGKVIEQGKGEKITVFKYKPKKGYHRKKGHRQELTRVEIEDIVVRKTAPRKSSQAASKK